MHSTSRKSVRHSEPRPRPDESAESEHLQERVAENLRRYRKEKGWTLDELAQRSGVSRAMLSQIESRKTNPTIAVVWKISTAFGLNFSALLGDEPGSNVTLMPASEAHRLTSSDGTFVSRPLFPRGVNRRSEFYELRLKPGAHTDAPPHPPGTRENLVVVKGGLTIHIGGREYVLGEGDAIEFAADVPHAYENHTRREFVGYEVIEYR